SRHLVARDQRIGNADGAVEDFVIGAADAAVRDADQHLPWARLRLRDLVEHEIGRCAKHHCFHGIMNHGDTKATEKFISLRVLCASVAKITVLTSYSVVRPDSPDSGAASPSARSRPPATPSSAAPPATPRSRSSCVA